LEIGHLSEAALEQQLVNTVCLSLAEHNVDVVNAHREVAAGTWALRTSHTVAARSEPAGKAILAESMVATTERDELCFLQADLANAIESLTG